MKRRVKMALTPEQMDELDKEKALAVQEDRNNSIQQASVAEDSKLVTALINNDTAIDMAKKQYEALKNQKNIASKMSKVVNRKTKQKGRVKSSLFFCF